jgi:hypothetical protein
MQMTKEDYGWTLAVGFDRLSYPTHCSLDTQLWLVGLEESSLRGLLVLDSWFLALGSWFLIL